MMAVVVNDVFVKSLLGDSSEYECVIPVSKGTNSLRLMHFGKNYFTDCDPDKFFQLEKVWINDVDLKHHIHQFQQTAFLPPWDSEPPPVHSLYLGHNGYLELKFESPVNSWIQTLFGVSQDTMHGQQTTMQVLEDIKNYFNIV